MFEQVQVIKEDNEAKFAVLPYAEYIRVRELLSDAEQLADYLDYLHMQTAKSESRERVGLHTAKEMLGLNQQFPELGYTGVLWLGKGGKAGIFQE